MENVAMCTQRAARACRFVALNPPRARYQIGIQQAELFPLWDEQIHERGILLWL